MIVPWSVQPRLAVDRPRVARLQQNPGNLVELDGVLVASKDDGAVREFLHPVVGQKLPNAIQAYGGLVGAVRARAAAKRAIPHDIVRVRERGTISPCDGRTRSADVMERAGDDRAVASVELDGGGSEVAKLAPLDAHARDISGEHGLAAAGLHAQVRDLNV